MRWLSLMTKECAKDKYAVGFVTHTVAKTLTGGRINYEANRLTGPDATEAKLLGIFHGENGFEMAKLCVENDAREQRRMRDAADSQNAAA